jgi:Pyridoxamine 5'-phosphate oxidase
MGKMSIAEREAFLAGVHVGVLAVNEPRRGPLALPVWYRYVDGVVVMNVAGGSKKEALLRKSKRATLTVQDETPPYRYVSVEGTVTVERGPSNPYPVAIHYLGAESGIAYVEANPELFDSSVVRLTPKHWRCLDFATNRPSEDRNETTSMKSAMHRFRQMLDSGFEAETDVIAEDFVWHYVNPHLPDLTGEYEGIKGLRSWFENLQTISGSTFSSTSLETLAIGQEFVTERLQLVLSLGDVQIETDSIIVLKVAGGQIHEGWDIPSVR